MSRAKTVKVRIAVAVDEHGRWQAYGGTSLPDRDVMSLAVNGTTAHIAWRECWVTAELPIPEPLEVAGEVEVVG